MPWRTWRFRHLTDLVGKSPSTGLWKDLSPTGLNINYWKGLYMKGWICFYQYAKWRSSNLLLMWKNMCLQVLSRESLCYIPRYMDVWNDIGNSKYTTFTKLVQVLYYLWVKGYSTWGERDTIFLCWLLLHRQLSSQPTRGARSAQICMVSPSLECRLSRSKVGTQLCFSHIP